MEKKKVVDKCTGCKKITEDGYCMVYVNPEGRWLMGGCGISTHIPKTTTSIAKMMNPIKASKKKVKSKK